MLNLKYIPFAAFAGAVIFSPAALAQSPVKICQPDQCEIPQEGPRGELLTDFEGDGVYEPFIVKSVAYAPTPIGTFYAYGGTWEALCTYQGPAELAASDERFLLPPKEKNYFDCSGRHVYHDRAILDRDFALIKAMGANSIRTWGPVTPELMDAANAHGLKVIAGFWIDHALDYVHDDPEPVIKAFLDYVARFEKNPAILMWGLSNENNMSFCAFAKDEPEAVCDPSQQARAFAGWLDRVARAARARFPDIQPIMPVFAELHQMRGMADDLKAMDVIGLNSYRGTRFGSLFEDFTREFPDTPMLITEFGFDAWDTGEGREDQDKQARFTVMAWEDIERHLVSAGGPNLGGVVFVYSDGWDAYVDQLTNPNINNGQWTPSVAHHDTGFIVFPDGAPWTAGQWDDRFNIEWAGIMAVEKDPSGGPDRMVPRQVYEALRQAFTATPMEGGAGGDGG